MRLPQFTIRDLLWLMVVVGLALGWLNEHRRFEAYFESVNIKWKPGDGGHIMLPLNRP